MSRVAYASRAFRPARKGEAGLRILLSLLCALCLSACAMTETGFAPRSSLSLDKDIAGLEAQYGLATSLQDYYSKPETAERRNEFVAARLALYDLEYMRFVQGLRLGRAEADTLFDHSLLGLGLATTLAAGEHTKTVLGAVTTAITGSRASFDKNFFADKTTGALVSQMNAERKEALLPIAQGVSQSVQAYPMTRAIIDLNAYQMAGTIEGALQGVHKDAAAKDAAASAAIDRLRDGKFVPDASTWRITSWLYPGYTSFDADGVAHDGSGATVAINSANYQALRAEMVKLHLDGVTLESLLNDPANADARAQAIADLKIP